MKLVPLFGGLFFFACCASTNAAEISGGDAAGLADTGIEQDSLELELVNDTITICSFNIQFLGSFKDRKDSLLADVLDPYDIVVIQEMVSPPIDGFFPDGTAYSADKESQEFVQEMEGQGFTYWLSEEDTGPKQNHTNSTGSEWWITFYRPEKVVPDSSRYYGFLDTLHTLNPDFDRVPFAFPFKSLDERNDFTLISVHLKPGNGTVDRARRQHELVALFDWVKVQEKEEENHDFIILGDCNIYKLSEFEHFEEQGVFSLNRNCQSTNTKLYELASKGRPYDHVFSSSASTEEIIETSFTVVDIMEVVRPHFEGDFPFEPYSHDFFRTRLSDHLPVTFQLIIGVDSD